ncbi:MAG: DUF481 domain-containing protein, partial [Bacteroidota bacterium]
DNLVWEAFTQLQFDQILRIQRRWLLGTGLRFDLRSSPSDEVHLGISYMYEYEQEKDTSVFHRDSRLSSYLSVKKKFSEHVSLSMISYYQPRFDLFSDYRLSLGTGLGFKIAENLSFVLNINLTYDAKPVIDEEINSLTYNIRNGISFKF